MAFQLNELLQLLSYAFCSIIGSAFLGYFCIKRYYKYKLNSFKCNRNMAGKTVLITGANSGIGKATAQDLAKRNARVILACRNLEKARKVVDEIKESTGNSNVLVKLLDLSSFESVRKFAVDILNTEKRLDILINNAGMGLNKGPNVTEDGYEMIMQSNYLGHFLLTLSLLNLLKKSAPSRIINVASELYKVNRLNNQDFDLTSPRDYPDLVLYGHSNLARILFSRELAKKLLATGVTVNSLHPGYIYTNVIKTDRNFLGIIFELFFFLSGQNTREGAQTSIKLAVDPNLETTTGKFFSFCEESKLSGKAVEEELGRKLFEMSEQAVGLSFSDACL